MLHAFFIETREEVFAPLPTAPLHPGAGRPALWEIMFRKLLLVWAQSGCLPEKYSHREIFPAAMAPHPGRDSTPPVDTVQRWVAVVT